MVWSSGTYDRGATLLVIQDDCDLVLYNKTCQSLWKNGVQTFDPNVPPGAPVTTSPQTLNKGDTLEVDERLRSTDEKCALFMNGQNGNLEIHDKRSVPEKITFSTNTGNGNRLEFKDDGNLVVVEASGNAVFSFNTNGLGGTRLIIEDDCEVHLFDPDCNIVFTFPQTYF